MGAFDLRKKKILVTGASSGLGKELAIQLARDYSCDLVIAARRADRLLALKEELESTYSVNVSTLKVDLSNETEIKNIIPTITSELQIDAAILNAGVTYFGRNLDMNATQFKQIVDTNIVGVVEMTNALAKYFDAGQKDSAIMLVSSMSAFFPAPYQSVYSASKAFLLAYAQAFAQELKNPNLSITVFTPGGIKTEMTAGESFGELQSWLMPVNQAAKEAIYALKKRKDYYIPGITNRIGARFMRLLPRTFLAKTMAKVYVKSLDKEK